VVLVAGAAGVGVLVVQRSQQPAVELGGNPTATVRSAITTTRQALAELSVTHETNLWVPVDGGPTELDELLEDSDPIITTTTVVAANSDWSYETEQLTLGPDGGTVRATFGMRYVDGRRYERPATSGTWERLVAEDGERPTEHPAPLLDGRMVVDLLERYDGEWTVRRDAASGLTRYDATDPDEAYWLAVGIGSRSVPSENASAMPYGASRSTTTVQVWIDDETGRIRRLHIEQRMRPDTSEGGSPFVEQQAVTLHHGGASPVEVPDPVTDLPLEDWCARNVGSCR
jgi:hypothetical protein